MIYLLSVHFQSLVLCSFAPDEVFSSITFICFQFLHFKSSHLNNNKKHSSSLLTSTTSLQLLLRPPPLQLPSCFSLNTGPAVHVAHASSSVFHSHFNDFFFQHFHFAAVFQYLDCCFNFFQHILDFQRGACD